MKFIYSTPVPKIQNGRRSVRHVSRKNTYGVDGELIVGEFTVSGRDFLTLLQMIYKRVFMLLVRKGTNTNILYQFSFFLSTDIFTNYRLLLQKVITKYIKRVIFVNRARNLA